MRLVHMSDTHLGYFEYARIDPETGLNQREQDFYRAWRKVIDDVLADPPDLVLHAGDLFHTPRPTNRAIRVAFEAIKQVADAGIPFVVISGNHSTPRIRATGSIFETLALLPNVHVAYVGQYRRVRIGGVAIHCVPHTFDEKEWRQAFDEVSLDPRAELNILLTHGTWCGRKDFAMGEFGEQGIPDLEARLGALFDYIALGHYHRRVDINDHVSYCGSTERTGLDQMDAEPGYLRVDVGREIQREYIPVPARPMVRVEPQIAGASSAQQVLAQIEKEAANVPEGAIVDLRLLGIPRETYLRIDFRELERIFSHCLAVVKTVELAAAGREPSTQARIGNLAEEFERFLLARDLPEEERKRLKEKGESYLGQQLAEGVNEQW
ncbi:MAG: exonuclease SbcCD subunit D [candidate division KSB1 bacterium]|nr:exonuclease SbcCD subunit D [candidate division KSB1 bacterium]